MKDMKRIVGYLSFALIAAVVSCSQENILPEPLQGNGVIMLDVSSMPHTKVLTDTDLASVGAEAYVNHADLFIFGEKTDGSTVYHERFAYSSPASPDTKTVGIKKNRFKSGQAYDIYVIANSTASADEMSTVADVDDLETFVQSDEFIHFTGLDEENVPEAFLMDAKMESVVINPAGYEADDKVIDIQLTRAAAKILVELYEDAAVDFQSPDNTHVYHFRNLPYSTSVLDGMSHYPSIRSTQPHQVNDYVKWNPDAEGEFTINGSEVTVTGTPQISITGYVYAYDYSAASADEHTSLVVNVPLKMTVGSDVKDYPVNYYKIPLTNALKFERNKMYRIRAAVRAPGAQTSFDPIVIDDLSYSVLAWDSYTPPITVGGEANRPKYLQLNTELVEMYNINEDNTTLTFASSSEINSVELINAYYYNKHGVETPVADNIKAGIAAVAEEGVLNGGIDIFSPIVATTAEERIELEAELLAELGLTQAPSAPTDPPKSPELSKVDKPDPDDYLPGNTWRWNYWWEGSDAGVKFYRTNNFTSSTEAYASSQRQYDDDYAAYQTYMTEWGGLTDAQKQDKLDQYEAALEEYELENAVYFTWLQEYRKIQATANPSHYNTIRYLEFKVTNEQGVERNFKVEQYPVIYITNSLGWYSYRKDFKTGTGNPTTYQAAGPGRIVAVSLNVTGTGEYDWENSYKTSTNNSYWFSKVRTGTNATGSTDVSSYTWNNSGTSVTPSRQSSTNLRLYHVNVTTTSKDYVVGKPKMVRNEALGVDVTDPSKENSKLVSPSFMIASRLGYFITDGGNIDDANDAQRLNIFRVHCANYVEVHGTEDDPIIYDNWRLPTEAELKIIMDTQGESGQNAAAVDYLLNALYYFGAAGPVFNSKNDDDISTEPSNPANYDSKSVRCVRDAF